MTWFDSIYDLQYYHQPKGVPCYCEAVGYPSDMYLQGSFTNGGATTLKIYVYSADGITQYEDATSYFDYHIAYVGALQSYIFNARLKSFSPAMCQHECYVLRAVVTSPSGTIFDKYTERYCQNNCCDTARGITFDQDGFVVQAEPGTDPITNGDPAGIGIPASPTIFIPEGDCGEPLIRIISVFDCVDKFNGEFYGIPNTTISQSGGLFAYRKVTTIKGRIVRRPREISREISYNCKVQRVESTPQYLLEGYEYLPAWKMFEIEGQLHANRIFIDDFKNIREYRYAGGTPMKQLSKCFELFKLETTLEDCTQRQIFGCKENCTVTTNPDGSNLMFAIPSDYNGGGFFDEQKEKIADDYDGLLNYLRTRNGMTDTQDVNTASMNCSVYKVASVTGSGLLPSHIYYDAPVPGKRIFGSVVSDINDFCGDLQDHCQQPVVGVYEVTIPVCNTPVNGSITVEHLTEYDVIVNGYGDWAPVDAETYGSIHNGQVTFSIKVVNTEIVAEGSETEVLLSGVWIGNIGSNARPELSAILDEYNNANMPTGVSLLINEYGNIYYSGPAPADSSETTIDLNNLVYNL